MIASAAWIAWVLAGGAVAGERPNSEATPASAGPIVVRVEGIRPPRGLLQLSLFATGEGYPEDFRKAARTLSVAATDSTVTVRFDSVPAGPWALAILHDLDGDGRLDRSALGVPREGIGASHDAVRRLGPPRFRDARFLFQGDSLALRVRLRYW
jgi:uncharacterized protein (DUF2141 family)